LRTSRIGGAVLAVAASLGVAACGSSSNTNTSSNTPASSSSTPASTSTGPALGSASGTINGAGSTLAAPIYQQWGSTLSGQGVTVNFNPIGSGAGVAELQTGTVDFAGSDPAMKAAEIAKAKGPVLQFPIAFGAITVSYNLPGVKSGLKLDGKTIADMFLGKVKTWSDPEIKALNPGMSLPSTAITIVHRSDSSGTTKGFVTFLAAYDPAWVATAGVPDKTAKWPTGTGAAKNAGVAAAIKQTPGAVGYVEQAYALQNGMTYASVKNSTGSYVEPSLAATTAAAATAKIPPDLTVSTINAPGATAYPIVSQTFLIVYKDMCKAGVAQGTAGAVKKFLAYGLGAGQAVENQLFYASLPPTLLADDTKQLGELTCNGAAL
jgi:phosphate transport system substrate-binding protein